MFLFNGLFVLLPFYSMVTRIEKDNRSATERLLICSVKCIKISNTACERVQSSRQVKFY